MKRNTQKNEPPKRLPMWNSHSTKTTSRRRESMKPRTSFAKIAVTIFLALFSFAIAIAFAGDDDFHVKTPGGTCVKVNIQNLPPFPEGDIPTVIAEIAEDYGDCGATYFGPPDENYNCHSYAWFHPYTNNNAWMPSPSGFMGDHYCPVELFSRGPKPIKSKGNTSELTVFDFKSPSTFGHTLSVSQWKEAANESRTIAFRATDNLPSPARIQ